MMTADSGVVLHENLRLLPWSDLLKETQGSLDLVAYYYDSWINQNWDAIVDLLCRKDTRLRMFMSDPEEPEVMLALRRLFPEHSQEVLLGKVRNTGERLRLASIEAGRPEAVEIRLLEEPLSYSAQCIDESQLFLSVFEMYRTQRISSPATEIDLRRSRMLGAFWAKELAGLLEHDYLLTGNPSASDSSRRR